MDIAADHGQAHTRQRTHAETFEHDNMAMAAADEHDIPERRLIRHLHEEDTFIDGMPMMHDSA